MLKYNVCLYKPSNNNNKCRHMFHNYNTSLEAVDKLNYNFFPFSPFYFSINEFLYKNDLYESRSIKTDFIKQHQKDLNRKFFKSWPPNFHFQKTKKRELHESLAFIKILCNLCVLNHVCYTN